MLARILIPLKRWKDIKKIIKKTITFLIFIILACLPFIYITEIIGLKTFYDSFENSHYYICVQDKDNKFESNTNGDFLIIQKSIHPDFIIKESDSIIYCKYDGDIAFTKISQINSIAAIKRYYIKEQNKEPENTIIFEDQILGKIVKIIDDTIWNSISIKIWETSIHNLNLRAILINNWKLH